MKIEIKSVVQKFKLKYVHGDGQLRREKIMAESKRPKKVKQETKQAHFECEVALYKDFEKYCYGNGKSVAEALRAYMKMCIGK